MNRSTHVLFGTSLSVFILNPHPSELVWIITLSVLGSYIPDIDLRVRHRMLMHNVFVLVLFSITLYYVLNYLSVHALWSMLTAFVIGFLSHIVLDMFTYAGVSLFYPISSRRYRIAKLKSNSRLVNALFSIIALLLLFAWVYRNKLINVKPFGLQEPQFYRYNTIFFLVFNAIVFAIYFNAFI